MNRNPYKAPELNPHIIKQTRPQTQSPIRHSLQLKLRTIPRFSHQLTHNLNSLIPRCKRKQHSMDKDKLDFIQSHNSSIRILWLSIRFVSSSSIFSLSIQKFTCKESRFSYNDLWLHFFSLQINSSSSSSPIRCMLNKINGSQRRRLFWVYKLLS